MDGCKFLYLTSYGMSIFMIHGEMNLDPVIVPFIMQQTYSYHAMPFSIRHICFLIQPTYSFLKAFVLK